MTQQINFAETTIDKIIRLLRASTYGGNFKEFFYGDDSDMDIPTDSQPAIVVDLLDSGVKQGPTAADDFEENIKIKVVLNKKTYMDDFDFSTVSWKKQLELLVQGNNPITQQYDPTTILGILRTNFTLGNFATNQIFKIKYGEVPQKNSDESTGEAWIMLTVAHFQNTPNKV